MSTTATMSSRTASWSPPRSAPMLITMSISSAPSAIATPVSKDFTSVALAPKGKPTTVHTLTLDPASSTAAAGTQNGFTHTLAKPYCRASAHNLRMSATVASGFKRV